MEPNLMNLVENYAFGAGSFYYEQLPTLIKTLYENKNWSKSKVKIFNILKTHMKPLNLNN